jgi:hypothetical protein
MKQIHSKYSLDQWAARFAPSGKTRTVARPAPPYAFIWQKSSILSPRVLREI